MKKIATLFLACILLLSLCACSSEPALVGSNATQNTVTPTKPSNKVFNLGDSVEMDDVIVSFLDVTESKGSKYNKPADGKVFVLCEFEIVNNSKEDLAVSSMLSFDAYCDDYSCDLSFSALTEKGNKEQLDGTVAAGKKMKGVIGFELPTDWKELEIHYTSNILTGNEIVFVAANN